MRKRGGALGATTMIVTALVLAAPAAALVAHWFNTGTAAFAGSDCGDTSDVVLTVPRNAFGVSVVRPQLGTKLTDASTGQTDATVTAIRRTAAAVTFTATGSDDVCANPDRYADNGSATTAMDF